MNSKDTLSQHDLECLSALYLECRMSRLEEIELEYVLARTEVSSPVIDEARAMMRMCNAVSVGAQSSRPFRWPVIYKLSVAASAAILVVVASVSFLVKTLPSEADLLSPGVTVYVHGERVYGEEAIEIAEQERVRCMAMVDALKAESRAEQLKYIDLMNLKTQ